MQVSLTGRAWSHALGSPLEAVGLTLPKYSKEDPGFPQEKTEGGTEMLQRETVKQKAAEV